MGIRRRTLRRRPLPTRAEWAPKRLVSSIRRERVARLVFVGREHVRWQFEERDLTLPDPARIVSSGRKQWPNSRLPAGVAYCSWAQRWPCRS